MAELNAVEEATISNSSTIEQNKEKSDKQKDNATAKKVPFYKLFSFADSTDMALMVIGSVGAVGNGLAMPLMAILWVISLILSVRIKTLNISSM